MAGNESLFPMEKLFERYVAACLRDSLRLTPPSTSNVKANTYASQGQESLPATSRPDDHSGRQKLGIGYKMEATGFWGGQPKLWLKRAKSDFYQLFAYGHKYLKGQGDFVLIVSKYGPANFPGRVAGV